MDIVEFLRARLDEDEAVAREAMSVPDGIEQTVSVPQDPDAEWRAFDPDGNPLLVHTPRSLAPDAPLDVIGEWGWSGGPWLNDPDSPEQKMLNEVFGEAPDEPDAPYQIGDSGLWDDSDKGGATFRRAWVPAAAGAGTVRHICTHDPQRVLREVEAKRRIVDRAEEAGREFDRQCAAGIHSAAAREATAAWVPIQNAVADLATAYADHEDYNPDWTT